MRPSSPGIVVDIEEVGRGLDIQEVRRGCDRCGT